MEHPRFPSYYYALDNNIQLDNREAHDKHCGRFSTDSDDSFSQTGQAYPALQLADHPWSCYRSLVCVRNIAFNTAPEKFNGERESSKEIHLYVTVGKRLSL